MIAKKREWLIDAEIGFLAWLLTLGVIVVFTSFSLGGGYVFLSFFGFYAIFSVCYQTYQEYRKNKPIHAQAKDNAVNRH